MTEPGRVTVRHADGSPASIPEISRAITMTMEETTVRLTDSPGTEQWIEADKESVASLGSWC